eukprot:222229-Pelagomonas_calceolata.AAC.2
MAPREACRDAEMPHEVLAGCHAQGQPHHPLKKGVAKGCCLESQAAVSFRVKGNRGPGRATGTQLLQVW